VARTPRTAAWTLVAAGAAVSVLAALAAFVAPDLFYTWRDRAGEVLTGRRGRPIRIALGAPTGSNARVGRILNRHLQARAGYQLEPVNTAAPGNVSALAAGRDADLAIINSADDEAVRTEGVVGLAALEDQHFFVIVPWDSGVQELRDLAGAAVNPGVRGPGDPPTLGERVLDYYGLLAAEHPAARPASVVRPVEGNLQDFAAGRMHAATRTQDLQSELVGELLRGGQYRLVPIRDNVALAAALPGARPGTIPAGLHGPDRRIPAEPIPTIVVTQLLVARADLPARVARDILDVLYHPRFGREARYALDESTGRQVAGLPLHPAATVYYRRNEAVTSERLGRISFVASALAALFAGVQLAARLRRGERQRRRRQLLEGELITLERLRSDIEASRVPDERRRLLEDADAVLWRAELDAVRGLLDAQGIQAMRSVHGLCWRAAGLAKEGGASAGVP
jgi:TRAP-type uncharacterized transport system substrate-binding protein